MKAQLPEGAQYRLDQQLLVQLQGSPISDDGVVTCCRLLIRYRTGIGESIGQQALAILAGWGLDQAAANALCREIWAAGFRPPLEQGPVGSGSDTAAA